MNNIERLANRSAFVQDGWHVQRSGHCCCQMLTPDGLLVLQSSPSVPSLKS